MDNVKGDRRIYESVRSIYDFQSSSEDSLDHRKCRRSLIKNSRAATRTASLFIDRLKNEFQRGDDFVPRFRSHRNWCPSKFPSKYFSDREDRDVATFSLGKSVSKNFVHETPRIFAIGLSEPKMTGRIDDDDDEDEERDDDTIQYLQRCSLLGRRTTESDIPKAPIREKNESKKSIFALPSLSTLSIPLLPSLPIPMDCIMNNKSTVPYSRNSARKNRVASCERSKTTKKEERICKIPRSNSFEKDPRRCHEIVKKNTCSSEIDSKVQWNGARDDFVFYSISLQSIVPDGSDPESATRTKDGSISNEGSSLFSNRFLTNEITPNDCFKHGRITVNIVNCKTSQEFLRDGSPDQLVDDLYPENISVGSSTSKSKEFFSPIETSRQTEIPPRVTYDEHEILEHIKRRIDADFERPSLKFEEDFDDICLSHDSRCFDKSYSLDSESFLDLDDDLLSSMEQSKSMPALTSTATKRRTSKSVTLMSSTLIEDDINDLKSPNVNLSRETFKDCRTNDDDVNDPKYPSSSSMNSILYPSTYDFPFSCLESTIVSQEKCDAIGSALDRHNFEISNLLSRSFSISDISLNKEYESASSKNGASCLDFCRETEDGALTSSKCETARGSSDFERSRTNLTKSSYLQASSLKQRKSSKYLVESIDSGVMTDYSRNDLRASRSIPERIRTKVRCYVYENPSNAREQDDLPMFDFDSDSSYSDESLDRRVDRAVKKCTEDLIRLERRVKVKIRRMDDQENSKSNNDLAMFSDWSSADERLGNISTPSLVSLTDSETS